MSKIDGNKIREARKSKGLSQEALAQKLGVSKVAICWYENGDRTPALEHFLALAKELDLSLDELVGEEVSVVAEDDTDYNVKLSKKDLIIINKLKEKKDLYKKLYNDPKRVIDLIDRKMK